jgi:hypothetical protein
VANVQRRATGMFLGADVLPAVDFSRLDEVMVVISDPGAPAEPDGGVAPTSSASSAAGAEARP